MAEQWVRVSGFGNGDIYACGNRRRLVTPGMRDFEYVIEQSVPVATLVKAVPQAVEIVQATPPVKGVTPQSS